jgi:hypothetical protein
MKRWSEESIKAAIRDWTKLYGDPPISNDWQGPYRPSWVPTTHTVRHYFGTWNAAIQAAGFKPRSRGAAGHVVRDF